MNHDLILVLGLLIACVAMFIANRPRMDVVGLIVLIALPLSGILTVPETLAGFSDPNVLLIAALFVIGAGLSRTGIAYQLSDWLVRQAGTSESRLLILLMLSVAILGSVMSSTGVVAIFIPVVLSVAERLKITPGRLMMPLSFAGLISGMLTLVATPPNMVVNSALTQGGFAGFGFFSFTPIGVVILVLGIGYMLIATKWIGRAKPATTPARSRRKLIDFIRSYDLARREYRVRILPGSSLIGRTLRELTPRQHGANVVAIERRGKFSTELLYPGAETSLREGDVLLIDVITEDRAAFRDLEREAGLEALPLRGSYFTDQSREVGMAEIVIPPDSGLIGQTILSLTFRRKYGINVIGLRRGNESVKGAFLEEKLRLGDTLLVIGPWKAIRRLQTQTEDFLVLNLPTEIDEVAPAVTQAPYALLSLAVMVLLMISGVVPNVVAALIGCLLMGLFRCVTMDAAYKSIHWPILLLIVGVMPFATALERTGGIALAVDGLLRVFGDSSPHVLLGALFVCTAVIGLFISNTATAVLMAPLALNIAAQLGASPYPFVMTVALAASAAFMTPISSPVNTLVMTPGRYNFMDFVKVGVPFTVIVLFVCVILVPWLFPLR